MKRREFLTVTGAALSARNGERGTRNEQAGLQFRVPSSALRVHEPAVPPFAPQAFKRRIDRAQAELKTRKWDFLIATPSSTYRYFTGDTSSRSERLIALVIPAIGDPAIVCPAFEAARIKDHTIVADIRGWEERDNPSKLVQQVIRARKPRATGTIGLEASTAFDTYLELKDALSGWKFEDGGPIGERLRIVKEPEEVDQIRRAIAITEDAIAATFAQLVAGKKEQEIASVLAGEMERRGADGGGTAGGLVQFGSSSAFPHGAPADVTLAAEMPVLIDCGCRVNGYVSDITRTVWFGEHPSDEFRTVYNLVHDAQTAALQLGRPLLTQAEEMDQAARKVIADGGFGPNFTHRLGHGIGLDGHEPPYLVDGNELRLEPGMVFTLEPGIYQEGKFGVRIEDDCVMTENGVEVLSRRTAKL